MSFPMSTFIESTNLLFLSADPPADASAIESESSH